MPTDVPLTRALNKVGEGNVAVRAPEWANETWLTLLARAVVAGLLFILVATIVWHVGDELPGEASQKRWSQPFGVRAAKASDAAADALVARREANSALKRSRARVAAARLLDPPRPALVQRATQQRNSDRLQYDLKRRSYRHRVEERAAALSDVVAMRPASDVDLVRAVGVGAVVTLAVLGTAALLVPRRGQTLDIRSLGTTVGNGAHHAGATEPFEDSQSASSPPEPNSGPRPSAGLAEAEPAVTQGFLASIALIAGLYGIQQFEGTAELLLNAGLPLVPIVGALFTRSRVASKPNLKASERIRLFHNS